MTTHADQLNVFVFSEDGDQPLVALKLARRPAGRPDGSTGAIDAARRMVQSRAMLKISDITYSVEGRPCSRAPRPPSHRPQGRPCRPQRRRQDHALPPDPGRAGAGGRRDHPAPRARIGGVAQEVPSSSTSLLDTVLAADTERAALMAEAETATDPHRIAEIQHRLADIDAWSAEGRGPAFSRVWASMPRSS
jgi:ATP-binding cassette subfamily F protein 3